MCAKDFPLGHAVSPTCWRMILGYVLVITLLPTGSILAASSIHNIWRINTLSQIPEVKTAIETAELLAGKSLSFWLILLSIIILLLGGAVIKWLLNQNTQQRDAHTKINERLMEYLSTDKVAVAVQLAATTAAINRNSDALSENARTNNLLLEKLK